MTNLAPTPTPAPVIWLTGLSGAGKTTIADALTTHLRAKGILVEWLDGDEIRTHLSKGLGFSRDDRNTNVLRIGYVASLLARNGVTVVVSAISPYRESRDAARKMVAHFLEVHVSAPLTVCAERDVKGLYKRAFAGEIEGFTGVSDPYESPLNAELVIETAAVTVTTAIHCIEQTLRDHFSTHEASAASTATKGAQ